MPSYAAAALLGLSALTSAMPSPAAPPQGTFTFPLAANNFPTISAGSPQVTDLQKIALGSIPKAANATATGSKDVITHADTITSIGFIAFNEIFEVAFFSELIANITAGGMGFDNIPNKDYVLKVLNVVLAQEELHALNAEFAFNKLTGNKGMQIEPCVYDFQVDNFIDAIALASKFTDVVLGTLPDIQTLFSEANDTSLIRGVGAVIGQEGEQNGFYRQILGKNPSALPFLTGSARDFAFSAINQNFVVPNSCPSLGLLHGLQIFDVLNIDTNSSLITSDSDSMINFSTLNRETELPSKAKRDMPKSYTMASDFQGLFITYINQQNAPVSYPIDWQHANPSSPGGIAFNAPFPGKSNEMNGLTIAVVTDVDNLADPDAVADHTIFGPALIEIN